ncbi:MAG: site-specific DNA-methyltransferase [Clostridium botulinum]|uniref:Type III restriction-modification system methylation subunit n=1 Tax=Clostridium botulinum B2 450 TaxID=1379739 RepID=A0A0D1BW45_CLOBO|nr:site-specific DNA-methyltransferase [Clostridium botulinum]KIS24007.1 type III restriction-modification system methylation subunit [Clostridium botulinum B2 450]MBE6075722.1 site-specific DNA-methyltransferase [Clostridium lundense]MDU2831535.1 site-specific DNA-methyltransferase [Clostridium botulinum]MDU5116393.1 site-specific DNA-methyltransferase [Clostridium botulinum]
MVVESKLMLEVKTILKGFGDKYFDGDKLKKHKVTEDLNAYDEKLIQSLLNNKTINRDFVISLNGKEIFKLNEFIDMFQYKEFWQDSYTKYANKIGLTVGGKFIDECEDVVLDFPYKDTVLKAGMTKEDKQKEDLIPNEMFLNETIAKDEIDILLDKKIFKNVKKYSAEGVKPISEFKGNDNLIVKGNNLIALHSLRDKYAGKIKLIYMDPPYNTGSDSFLYNDKYNHSSWLTFMKNRLEIARDLLSVDGSIWINIDDDESHYLKVLSDSILGRNNFITNIIWKKKYSPQNDAKFFSDMHDHILVYAKNKENYNVNGLLRSEEMNRRYKNPDNDPRGLWKSGDLSVRTYNANTDYEIVTPSGRKVNPPESRCWRVSKEKFQELVADNRIWFGEDGNNVPSLKRFLTDVKQTVTPQTIWDVLCDYESIWDYSEVGHNQDARREILALKFDNADFKTPKPEKLIQRILTIGTDEEDIVLDFFMGSSTTQVVAMKMNRKFIGIEQMDYINTISVPRLQKVIEGEQGGISKDVNWQGGGSFIYAELFEKNAGFIKEILNSKTTEDLKKTYANMIFTSDLDFRADLSKIDWTMSFEDNQKLLVKIIDKNQLYFNYSEIDDSEVSECLTNEEIAFNKNFYEELEV